MRKVYLNITVKMIVNLDNGVEVGDFIDEMDYDFTSENGDIQDTVIENYEVTDSK